MNLGWRNSIGDNAVPAQFGVPMTWRSTWSNYEFTSWGNDVEDRGPVLGAMVWAPSFSFRVGNQIPTAIYNFSRFKDARVSFTASPFAFHETIPYPTFGLGTSFALASGARIRALCRRHPQST